MISESSGDFGLNQETIKKISNIKKEPKWMLELRLAAFEFFNKKSMPTWGPDLSELEFKKISYFKAQEKTRQKTWEDVPREVKDTFEKLGIPEAERKFLAGVATQYESEVVYNKLKDKWNKLGVVYSDCETGLKTHPELFKKYFGKVIPYSDNKFTALNTAFWSGGSFIYVPKGVKIDIPLQAFFWINSVNMGQFERTLIIADEDSDIHYVEGCTAPFLSESSLHSGVVEIFVEERAKVQYTTIQNWSKNVYNLTTQRGRVEKDASLTWVDANIGSKITMKYPAVILAGDNAYGEVMSANIADKGQVQDTGGKAIHMAPNTKSLINSKSICQNGGEANYRGLVKITRKAKNAKSKISCDSLIMDNTSRTNTYPENQIDAENVSLEHEARASKVDEDRLEYLLSRGLSVEEANALIVGGFLEPIIKDLPMEYAAELNALLEMSMEGGVG